MYKDHRCSSVISLREYKLIDEWEFLLEGIPAGFYLTGNEILKAAEIVRKIQKEQKKKIQTQEETFISTKAEG